MSKFKVGDKVRVNNGLIMGEVGIVTRVGKTISEVTIGGLAIEVINAAITPADEELSVGDAVRIDYPYWPHIHGRMGVVTCLHGDGHINVHIDDCDSDYHLSPRDYKRIDTEFAVGDTVRIDCPEHPRIHGCVGEVTCIFNQDGLSVSIPPDYNDVHLLASDVLRVEAETLNDTAIDMVNEAHLRDTASDWFDASARFAHALLDCGMYEEVGALARLCAGVQEQLGV